MNRQSVQITKIANGYNIIVPSYDKPFNPMGLEKEDKEFKPLNYIPKHENIFFKETLKDVFDFLTEIENNPNPDYNCHFRGMAAEPALIG